MSIENRDQTFTDVKVPELFEKVSALRSEGYRMAQICATVTEEGTELLYTFDKDLILLNLKLKLSEEEGVQSITAIYWPAFIFENEIHDLFGVKFSDSKLDYGGNFFKLSKKTPWKPSSGGE
jgi:NADH:ubiquinone oxidoreductase 27 kD subunit